MKYGEFTPLNHGLEMRENCQKHGQITLRTVQDMYKPTKTEVS